MKDNAIAKPPRIWPSLTVGIGGLALVGVVATAAQYVAASLSLAPGTELTQEIIEQWVKEHSGTPVGFFSVVLPIHLTMIAMALVAAGLSRTPWRQRLGLVQGIVPLRNYPILMFGCLGVQAIVSWAFLNHMEMSPEFRSQLVAFAQTGGLMGIALVLYSPVVAGFAEELLMRGFILNGLLRRWRPIYALAFSTFLFAFMHQGFYYMIAALFAGTWMAVVFWRTRSLWAAVACHFSNNFVWILLTRFSDDPSVPFYYRYTFFTIGVGVFGLIMLGISIWLLFRKREAH